MIHILEREQFIPATIGPVWDYFSTPRNLDELTPDELRFRIVRGDTPTMTAGQLIEYRVRFAPLLWSTWLTEIRHVREPEYFVDEQRLGPYRLWYHEHGFATVPGGVRMTDRVTYDIGFGLLGEAVHAAWVERKLRRIFAYRSARIAAVFPLADRTVL